MLVKILLVPSAILLYTILRVIPMKMSSKKAFMIILASIINALILNLEVLNFSYMYKAPIFIVLVILSSMVIVSLGDQTKQSNKKNKRKIREKLNDEVLTEETNTSEDKLVAEADEKIIEVPIKEPIINDDNTDEYTESTSTKNEEGIENIPEETVEWNTVPNEDDIEHEEQIELLKNESNLQIEDVGEAATLEDTKQTNEEIDEAELLFFDRTTIEEYESTQAIEQEEEIKIHGEIEIDNEFENVPPVNSEIDVELIDIQIQDDSSKNIEEPVRLIDNEDILELLDIQVNEEEKNETIQKKIFSDDEDPSLLLMDIEFKDDETEEKYAKDSNSRANIKDEITEVELQEDIQSQEIFEEIEEMELQHHRIIDREEVSKDSSSTTIFKREALFDEIENSKDEAEKKEVLEKDKDINKNTAKIEEVTEDRRKLFDELEEDMF